MATYNVGGFTFTNEDEAKRAKQELQAIENIKIRINISNPAAAKQLLYNCKIKGTFKTKVGMDFLNKLQQTAKNSVDNKQFNKSVNNTPVNKRVTLADMENDLAHKETSNQKNSESKKRIFIISAATVLSAVIIFFGVNIFNTFSISNRIIGKWEDFEAGGYLGIGDLYYSGHLITYEFNPDKSFIKDKVASLVKTDYGKYKISGDEITLTYDDGDVETYKIKIVDDQLFLDDEKYSRS